MNEVEQIILEGIALNIVPKSTLLKAINLYQKLEKFRVLTESMLNSDFDNRVKYKDLKNLVKSLDKLSFNKHPISKVQLDQLESLYQSWKSVKVEVNKLESTNIKELESIWRHTRKKTQIDLPWIEALHRKILILKLLSQDANDDSIDSTIPEIQQAFDDFSNKTFTVPKIDFEDAWNKLKKRINYTIQVMKRRRKEDTIECIQNDIKNLKQKGILLSSFDSEYCNSQRSHDWYKIVISEIHRMYDEVAMKDTNDKFEPLEEYRQLQFLTLQQVNQFLGSKSNINEICGVEPRKLLRSLNCIKWIFEYKSCIDYSTNGELSQDDAKRLVKIGKELKLKDEDIPEFSTLYESQKYLDLFDKFVNDENCFDSLDKLLKMKTSSSLEKLKGIMPKVEDNPKKKAKLEEIIEHMKLSMLLGKATKIAQKINIDLPVDLFGLRKNLNKKSKDCEDEKESKSQSQNQTNTRSFLEYDKACELLDIAKLRKLPEEAYWYKYLRDQLIDLEKWQDKYEGFEEWKENNKGKMHKQIKRSKDLYSIESIEKDLIENADKIIISVTDEINCLINDVKVVKNWIVKAERFLNELTLRNCKVRTSFTEQETANLERFFTELKDLPMISTKDRDVMTKIVIYHWLSQADKFIWVMRKHKDEIDSDDEPQFDKKSYKEWTVLDNEIKQFSDEQLLTKNGIYLTFIKHYKDAKRF